MYALVVLFSVLALTAAKPSGLIAAPIAYAAAPAAVSHQSRVDIHSSPAIIATAPVARIAEPTIIAEPAIISAPSVVAAPAAVSHQSRIDIKSTPGLVATAPLAYSAPLTLAHTAVSPAAFTAPIAIAAPVGIAGPTVPLDTPEVIAARAAHFQAKALAGVHLIRKRSVLAPYITAHAGTPIISTYAAGPLALAAPLTYGAHIAYTKPILTGAYGIHPW